MATQWKTYPIECREGLVLNLPPIQQGMKLPGSAQRLVNFEPSIEGGYRRINGYSKWDSTVVPTVSSSSLILGVGFFEGDAIAVREDKIYSSSGSGWTQIATGRTHSGKHRYHTFNFDGTRKIIGVDGTDTPYTWDGTTFTEITGSADVDGASHATSFKDHLFYAKGDLVTFSVPFDETDFTTGSGSGNFRASGDVTGMIVFRQRLFVFTETTIQVLDGNSSSDFALTSVSEDVGCVQPDTIQEVGTDIAFLSTDGVRLLGATDRIGDFSNAISSKQIQEKMVDFKDFYSTFSSVVIRDKSQYRIMGFLSGRNSSVTEGYVASQLEVENNPNSFYWGETKGIKSYSSGSWVYNGTEYVLFSEETGYVYRLDSGSTFDGTAITSSYWTPFISFDEPTSRTTLYKASMYFSPEGSLSGSLTVKLDQNNSSKVQPKSIVLSASGGGAVYGSATYGTSTFINAPDTNLRKQLVGAGFNASFQFEFDGGDPFIFDTMMVEHATEGKV